MILYMVEARLSPYRESGDAPEGTQRSRRRTQRRAETLAELLSAPPRRWPPSIAVDAAVARILAIHDATGGATFDIYLGDLAGQQLYSVSLYPERGVMISGRRIGADVLTAFVTANLDLLRDPRNCIGTWYNEADNITYLDISAVLPDREDAIALSRRYNQIAAFDLARLQVIETGGTGAPIVDLPPLTERLPKLRQTRRSRPR